MAYEMVQAAADNRHVEIASAACNSTGGCYNTTGKPCKNLLIGTERCEIARVPDGRCTRGSAAGCIWPDGSGFCVDDVNVPCLPDDPGERLLTVGQFASTSCIDAGASPGAGLCNVVQNDPFCECGRFQTPEQANAVGTSCPDTAPADGKCDDYEGLICGNTPQSHCSDGDLSEDGHTGLGRSNC